MPDAAANGGGADAAANGGKPRRLKGKRPLAGDPVGPGDDGAAAAGGARKRARAAAAPGSPGATFLAPLGETPAEEPAAVGGGRAEGAGHEAADSTDDDALADMAPAGQSDGEDACDPAVWRRHLQELKKSTPPRQRAALGEAAEPCLGPDSLARLARLAVQEGAYAAITSPAALPKPRDVAAAVDDLLPEECFALVAACAGRFRLKPRERAACGIWIGIVLDRRGQALASRPEMQRALEPLCRLGGRGLGHFRSAQALEVYSRWRHLAELARRPQGAGSQAASAAQAHEGAAAAARVRKEKRTSPVGGETATTAVRPSPVGGESATTAVPEDEAAALSEDEAAAMADDAADDEESDGDDSAPAGSEAEADDGTDE